MREREGKRERERERGEREKEENLGIFPKRLDRCPGANWILTLNKELPTSSVLFFYQQDPLSRITFAWVEKGREKSLSNKLFWNFSEKILQAKILLCIVCFLTKQARVTLFSPRTECYVVCRPRKMVCMSKKGAPLMCKYRTYNQGDSSPFR